MFSETENAGVLAKGAMERIIDNIQIRKDMDKDNRFAVNAVYQLFQRQAEMNVRLPDVLHC